MINDRTESVFGAIREETDVLNTLKDNQQLYYRYKQINNREWQQRFLHFLTGVKTLPVLYDPFFKRIFHPDIHPDRLERFLSSLLDMQVRVRGILPLEDVLVEGERLVIMDLLVQLEDGSLVLVEIQKSPYLFPAERISCYSSDLLMRQYSRVKGEKGKKFTYGQLKKVYTIVIYERSTKAFRKTQKYLHYGQTVFNTGLKLKMLQEFYLISLDVFQKNFYHKEKGERAGWLSLLITETVEEAEQNIRLYPWLEDIYREMAEYRRAPGEAMEMFSEALLQLDRNTAQYMIEEQQKEIEAQQKEIETQQKELKTRQQTIQHQQRELEQKDIALAQHASKIAELQKQLAELAQTAPPVG